MLNITASSVSKRGDTMIDRIYLAGINSNYFITADDKESFLTSNESRNLFPVLWKQTIMPYGIQRFSARHDLLQHGSIEIQARYMIQRPSPEELKDSPLWVKQFCKLIYDEWETIETNEICRRRNLGDPVFAFYGSEWYFSHNINTFKQGALAKVFSIDGEQTGEFVPLATDLNSIL